MPFSYYIEGVTYRGSNNFTLIESFLDITRRHETLKLGKRFALEILAQVFEGDSKRVSSSVKPFFNVVFFLFKFGLIDV